MGTGAWPTDDLESRCVMLKVDSCKIYILNIEEMSVYFGTVRCGTYMLNF